VAGKKKISLPRGKGAAEHDHFLWEKKEGGKGILVGVRAALGREEKRSLLLCIEGGREDTGCKQAQACFIGIYLEKKKKRIKT